MLFRTTLPSLVLLLFLLVTLVHADIDKKFEKFFRDRHDLDRGGSTVTVRNNNRFSVMDCFVPIVDSKQGVCVCVALEKLGLYGSCHILQNSYQCISSAQLFLLFIRCIEFKLTLTLAYTHFTLVRYRRTTSKPTWNDVNCTFRKCWRIPKIRSNDTWPANKESFKAKRYVRNMTFCANQHP
jgi:hypothetical protein